MISVHGAFLRKPSLKDSNWVVEPSVLRTADWLFNPNQEVIDKARLETSFTFVTDVASHAQFHDTSIEITDPLQLVIAEKKLILLAQNGTFPVGTKILTSGQPIKSNSIIATYFPLLCPAGILRLTDRIKSLVDNKIDLKVY